MNKEKLQKLREDRYRESKYEDELEEQYYEEQYYNSLREKKMNKGKITIKDLEKKYKIDFKTDPNKTLKEYLKDEGLDYLAEALSKLKKI